MASHKLSTKAKISLAVLAVVAFTLFLGLFFPLLIPWSSGYHASVGVSAQVCTTDGVSNWQIALIGGRDVYLQWIPKWQGPMGDSCSFDQHVSWYASIASFDTSETLWAICSTDTGCDSGHYVP